MKKHLFIQCCPHSLEEQSKHMWLIGFKEKDIRGVKGFTFKASDDLLLKQFNLRNNSMFDISKAFDFVFQN